MPKDGINFSLEGDKKLEKAFKELGKESRQRTVMRKSLNKASTPINKAAKSNTPRNTGTLKKSIGKVSRVYKSSMSVIVYIGPRTGHKYTDEDGNSHNPVNYGLLVEKGHAGSRPAPAHPFLRPAYDSQESIAQGIFIDAAWDNIQKEAQRVANKK